MRSRPPQTMRPSLIDRRIFELARVRAGFISEAVLRPLSIPARLIAIQVDGRKVTRHGR